VLDVPVVQFTLSKTDLNAIQLLHPLASSRSSSFLVVSSYLVTDTTGNPVVAVPSSSAMQASTFVQDSTLPYLVTFDLNMNTGVMTLHFSEPVRTLNFAVSAFTLQNARGSSPTHAYRLTSSSMLSSSNALDMTITFSVSDLNAIKARFPLAAIVAQTWLSIDTSAYTDMNFVSTNEIRPVSALQVSTYVADTTAPVVTDFQLDMNTGTLYLSFDEPVLANTLIIPRLVVYSASLAYTLQAGVVTQLGPEDLTLVVSKSDLDSIKLLVNLAISQSSSNLHVLAGAIQDSANTPNVNSEQQLACSLFIADTTLPTIVNFLLDMNAGVLTFNFDEPVQAATITPTAVTVQGVSSAPDATNSYTLTAGTASAMNSLQIVLTIAHADLDRITMLPNVFEAIAASYISVTSAFVRDMAGNSLRAISPNTALRALQFTTDATKPSLLSYDLNMDGAVAVLSLHFSETVDTTTLDLTKFSLQTTSSTTQPEFIYQLTAGTVVSEVRHPNVTIHLSSADLDSLKLKRIALTQGTTWLVMQADAISNVFSLGVNAVQNGINAMAVSQFTADTTKPVLDSFTFDMNSGTMALSFSEPVSAQTFKAIMLKLQNMQQRP